MNPSLILGRDLDKIPSRALLLTVYSKIAEKLLASQQGTIITGCVRSGTTLALRVYCSDLTENEEKDGSYFNEPRTLSQLIINWNIKKALKILPIVMLNRQRLIKSPHVAFLLPYVRPLYKIIVIFRDLRLVIPSMLRHPNFSKNELTGFPYWRNCLKEDLPENLFERAVLVAEQFYKNIIAYQGEIALWNYGFWDQWTVRNPHIKHLYGRDFETSESVHKDVSNGVLFSEGSFDINVWVDFCSEYRINKLQQESVNTANQCIKKLYAGRGLKIMTLDDWK